MKLYSPFGPTIAAARVSHRLLELLYTEALEIRADDKKRKDHDYRNQLAGNIAEEYSYGDDMSAELRILLDKEIKAAAIKYMQSVPTTKMTDIRISDTWVNFMKQGEWNPRHNHSGYISLVIFLRVPKEIASENTVEESVNASNFPTAGKLEFTYGESMDFAACSANITPVQGDMYLFPASLHHQVYPFISDVERVSVSINIYRSDK